MFARGEGGRRGPRVDRVGGLVLAMIAGSLLPVAAVLALAARDPLPRDCRSGPASNSAVEGALLYTSGADLWYSEGTAGKPRRLVDFAPARVRPETSASPRTGTPSPSTPVQPSVSAAGSPSPGVAGARAATIIAADISIDRKVVALVVTDPPGRPGDVGVMLVSPLDAPGTAPVLTWAAKLDRSSTDAIAVKLLDNGKVLAHVPVPASAMPAPSPAPARPAPSPRPSPLPSAAAAPASIPSPSASGSAPANPAVAVVVLAPGPTPAVVAQASESFFLAEGRAAWAETRSYRAPAERPRLAGRVDGPSRKVAGRVRRGVGTPLTTRQLDVVVVGSAGTAATQAVCSQPGLRPAAFSPDESALALFDGQHSTVLDLAASHAPARLVPGRLLAWR